MKAHAIAIVIWFGLAASGAAQSGPSGKPANPGASSQPQLSEIRALVHELEGRTEKLHELNTQYRSHMEQRPGSQEQQDKWTAALDRLLRRVEAAREAVVDTVKRLDQTARGTLPTALGKDLANARNDAEAERTAADHALAANKGKPGRAPKQATAKQGTPKAPPPPSSSLLDDDL